MEPKIPDPLEDEAEVVSNGCHDRIYGVALFVGKIVPIHPMAALEMTNYGFDGRSAPHLAFDGRRYTALLAGVTRRFWPALHGASGRQ